MAHGGEAVAERRSLPAAVASSIFCPQLTRFDVVEFAAKYEKDGDIAALAAGEAIRGGDFSRTHLQAIFRWKTGNRGKSRLDNNADPEIEDALRLAVGAETPRSAIAVLVGLHGVDTPVASAIMAVTHPEAHTVLDFRALEALGNPTLDRSLRFYLTYLSYCSELAKEWGMTLRDLDRGLWQWSKDRSEARRSATKRVVTL